jgi:hypothetical protein
MRSVGHVIEHRNSSLKGTPAAFEVAHNMELIHSLIRSRSLARRGGSVRCTTSSFRCNREEVSTP